MRAIPERLSIERFADPAPRQRLPFAPLPQPALALAFPIHASIEVLHRAGQLNNFFKKQIDSEF